MNAFQLIANYKDIIAVLTTKFNIEQIYLNTYNREKLPYELVILVSNIYVKTMGDLVPRITNSIRDYPEFRVSCYVAFQAKNKIRSGNLFLFTSCVTEKLLYKKEGSDFVLIPDSFDFEKFSKKVYDIRVGELKKVEEFKEGYFFYKEKSQHSMAAFMIHQAIELTYRYLEVVLSAKERVKHSIRGHHHYLQEITTMYVSIFEEENDTDQYLLNVLEDIYRSTRYEDNYNVKLEALVLLEDKLDQLNANAIHIYDAVISSFEKRKITVNEIGEVDVDKKCFPVNSAKSALDIRIDSLVDEISRSLPEDIAIYLFGKRVRLFEMESVYGRSSNGIYYFDFLIVSRNDIRELVNSVQDKLNERTDISVLLLSYQVTSVQEKLGDNNPFFHKIIQNKPPLFDSLRTNWEFHRLNGLRTKEELNKAKSKWYQLENNASGFCNGGKGIEHSEEVEIKVLLYNQAIEQACLGLLAYFYDYTPYEYNLKHLFGLCASLWQFPNDIFPGNTEEEKLLFDEFAQTAKDTRYQECLNVDWDEAYRYEARCERFIEECSRLVRGES